MVPPSPLSSTLHVCENFVNCQRPATQICSTCKQFNFTCSERLGRYCSRDCQKHSFHSHKYIHKLQKKAFQYQKEANTSDHCINMNEGEKYFTLETIVMSFQEIISRQSLPLLDENGTFSLLLVGTSDEVNFVYDEL